DDVLLLKPARPDTAFRVEAADAATGGRAVDASAPAAVLAAIYRLQAPADTARVEEFERRVAPVLQEDGVRLEAIFVTEPAENTFPRLPVREDENVLVWFGTVERDEPRGRWPALAERCRLGGQRPEVLELEPTARSILGHGPEAARASKHDFDFLFGSWKVHNRYLAGRLRGSTEWKQFESRCEATPLLHGLANIDRYTSERDGTPFEGMTLRLFDPVTAEWTLHWADSAHPGAFIPPMRGAFRGRVGEFYGDETVDGRTVRCRFLWTADPPRWEQAFSDDGGETWETNWIMEFTPA
ncbi:MAG TPA: hypothetical protein VJ788_09000, partial [Gemmatimonadota bacterium]|nr:hypothetical protein [Gemmatimonadota bacterium]